MVLPALIIIRTWSESALTQCFHEGGGREGRWRNLRLTVFFFLLLLLRLPQHTFFLSFLLSLCVFFRGGVGGLGWGWGCSFLPPSTQINIVQCHANSYVSLPCSLSLVFRKSSSQGVYLSFSSSFFFGGGGTNGGVSYECVRVCLTHRLV